jgi:WD40 repeat protein
VRVWDPGEDPVVRTLFFGGTMPRISLAFHPDNRRLAMVDNSQPVTLWDLEQGKVRELDTERHFCRRLVAFEDSGKTLALSTLRQGKGRVCLLNVESGRQTALVTCPEGEAVGLAVQGDGHRLALAVPRPPPEPPDRPPTGSSLLFVWDTVAEHAAWSERMNTGDFECVAFNSDGSLLATGGRSPALVLWEAATGKRIRTLEDEGTFTTVAFSPDGRLLAAGGWDGVLGLWDVASGTRLCRLEGHSKWVQSLAFSPDGSRLASASDDRTVRLWDTATGREVLSLARHTMAVTAVAFCRDGLRLASAGQDRTVRVWEAPEVHGAAGRKD